MNGDRSHLLPDDWATLAPLLDRLLDAPASDRARLLAEQVPDDAALRSRLRALVDECERDLSLLERPAMERFTGLLAEGPEPAIPAVLGGRYRIEHELGRGGMALVFLAHDLRHDRPVAVKVIRHEIATSLGRDRFLREIAIAARLRHPNIMPLYDSGDVDGALYFVMPYEPGKSLRARLAAGTPMGVADVVSILRDVARALAHAHEQGVVHRDIKPDNVLLSGGAAVVADFGIAKALTVAATTPDAGAMTVAGTVIGTPAYMAPEQATGDPRTDHRADVYSFGCLAYEMLSGTPPFAGATSHQIISAHLSERPRPVAEQRADVPEALSALVSRCLEKDPAARPASAGAILDALGTLPTPQSGRVIARRLSRRLAAAAVVVAATAVAWVSVARTKSGGPVSIAVLPLRGTGDTTPGLEVGLTEDLATALVRVPWLRVMSRSGAANYRGMGHTDARAVADSLGVQFLVAGSLVEDADGVALILQLMRGADGSLAWADKFARPRHWKELRDHIVRNIADTLRRDAGRFASRFPMDTARAQYGREDAYTAYLQGKQKLTARGAALLESLDFFRQAISLDSTMAEAWSGLSLALGVSAVTQLVHIDSVRVEATASAERARRLDPGLSEPWVALGVVYGLDWQWDRAEAAFRQALDHNPNDVEARIQYARVLISRSRLTEAAAQVEASRALDPASSLVLSFKSLVHLLAGNADSAMIWSDRAMRTDASNFVTRIFRAMLLVRRHQFTEARQLVQRLPPFDPYTLFVLGASGDSATVRSRLELLDRTTHPAVGTAQAYAYLGLGDTARGLAALERATVRREVWATFSPTALPVFDAVRDSPRFRAILGQAGLGVP
jgi:TolB-like protein/Flp pilus assembly protein TadD